MKKENKKNLGGYRTHKDKRTEGQKLRASGLFLDLKDLYRKEDGVKLDYRSGTGFTFEKVKNKPIDPKDSKREALQEEIQMLQNKLSTLR